MQRLVDAVRSTGADNVIMLGGLAWANDLSQWLTYEPSDPDHNLVASWHAHNFNQCDTLSCWQEQIAPVIAKVPLVAGEIGDDDCVDTYMDHLMSWLDARSTGYLAWAWNVAKGSCPGGSDLIENYEGDPHSLRHRLQSTPRLPRKADTRRLPLSVPRERTRAHDSSKLREITLPLCAPSLLRPHLDLSACRPPLPQKCHRSIDPHEPKNS